MTADLKKAYDELVEIIGLTNIHTTSELSNIFDMFTNLLKYIIEFDAIVLVLYGNENELKQFEPSLNIGFDEYLSSPQFFEKVGDVYQWVLDKGTNVFFPSEIAPGLNDLYIPLSIFERKLGIIHLLTSVDPLSVTQHQKTVLTVFANQISVALEHLRAIKQEKETYEELLQHEKINSLGYILSGIIHELNSPLTSVIGYTDLIMEECQLPPGEIVDKHSVIDLTNTLMKEARRASDIVQSLLKFVRKEKLEQKQININELVLSTLELIRYNFRVHQIDLQMSLEPELPLVMGNAIQLQQAFFNILNNAEQALTGHTDSKSVHQVVVRTRSEKDKIKIEISDNGPGISPENISKIFDPFFTTKKIGKGTGLGLSLTMKTITEHGGRIWVKNGAFSGVIFTIELPVHQTELIARQNDKKKKERSKDGISGNILVIDDEPTILNLLKTILKKDGHQVSTAHSIGNACKMVIEGEFDLIISDVHLPEMTGIQFYQWLKDNKPEFVEKIVFSTGDVVSPETTTFLKDNQLRCLFKPFHAREVRAFINKRLQGIG